MGVPCVSVLDPIIELFQSYLGQAQATKPGAQHVLNTEYFRRIDAMNYTLLHDDGQMGGDLDNADVILVGISRTSKTPTSIYLANRGIKTANIPLVPNIPLPPELESAKKPLIVGLIASADRIVDEEQTPAAILRQFNALEAAAKTHGAALGTGFSYPVTVEAAARWTAGLEARGLQLAPASAMTRRPGR
ncbi:putative pyruvate, phosphate dikinase regulatory protein [compost metagenome]